MIGRRTAGLHPWRLVLHVVCVLALMWPAIVNRQPFFFPDTTSYVRSADLAVQIASHGTIRTGWSRPRGHHELSPKPGAKPAAAAPRGSDGTGGNVMAGRSPYFGMLLYLGYVSSDFWLFVLAQALVAYLLIGLALRSFGLDGPRLRAIVTIGLALLSTVAYYDSLLLADALAGFGILAFLILATSRSRLSRGETIFLIAVVLMSVIAHLTHIVMLIGMTALLGLLALIRWLSWPKIRWAVAFGAIGVVVGLASVTLTGQVVKRALGKPPMLVPLMTARFIADGPGRDYIASGCDGGRFIVCHVPFAGEGSTQFLWSRTAPEGVFLPADAATRARMSAEDTAFARAVIEHYPLQQSGMIAWNTILQLAMFDSDIMAESCFSRLECNGESLPADVLADMRQSLSGRDLWPLKLMTFKDYAGVIVALAAIVAFLPGLRRQEPEAGARLLLWLALLATAMLINALLGGAVSEPQGRYQARIVWLLPLFGAIVVACRSHLPARALRSGRLPVAPVNG